MYGANFISWFSAQISSISGHISSGISPNQKILIEYEPIGIVASITPWNFPFAMIARKIAPAIAAGCSVILKPSELTPFSALAIAKFCKDACLPDGVLNIITGSADEISEIFGNDKRIRKLSFTGSTETGKILYSKSAKTLKKLSLELGGNSPFIVCQDADIEMAVNGLVAAKLRSTGQSCTSPNRIFLDSKISDDFINLLSDKFSNLIAGDGFNAEVNIGPLINKKSLHKIEKLIENAKENGANIVCGGKKSEYYISANGEKLKSNPEHNFFEPTILANCNESMDIFKTEIFGPVIACYEFASIDEVIKAANNTDYGLASYIYTNNFKTANQVADSLDYGIVGINESIISNEIGAFGGRKDSGFGVEGSQIGIYEYLITKYKMLSY